MNQFLPFISFAVTCAVIATILLSKLGNSIQDIPNDRSLHCKAVPRTGGVGLLLGALAGWSLMIDSMRWWVVIPLLLLFVVSILDDIYSLSVKIRLVAHMLASAVLLLGAGVPAEYGVLIAIAALFVTVWITNLYNFMDGSDGLAGGMALFGFSSYGIAALCVQDEGLAWASFTVAASALGFLLFNFHPAKIFLGDAGSIPLGFLVVAMGIWGMQNGDWSIWFPLIVFSPFIVDASVTLAKRSWRGAKITEAHREHYYQRAVQLGAGHRNVALFEYGLMFLFGGLAVWVRDQYFPWQALLVCVIVYVSCIYQVDSRWNSSNRASV